MGRSYRRRGGLTFGYQSVEKSDGGLILVGTKEKLKKALCVMLEEARKIDTWFDESNRETSGDYERWAPKDLLAHAAEWTERRRILLSDTEAVRKFQASESLDELNRGLFERHRNTHWDDVIEELMHGIEDLVREVDRRAEADLVAQDPNSEGRPVWRGIAFYGIVHSLTHIVQALVRIGNTEKAVYLQRSMTPLLFEINESDPWQAMVGFNLGRALILAGKREEAIERVIKAIEKHPEAAKWAASDPDMEQIRGDVLSP